MKENVNELNSVSVIQSVHCEGVGMVDEADGKKKEKENPDPRVYRSQENKH